MKIIQMMVKQGRVSLFCRKILFAVLFLLASAAVSFGDTKGVRAQLVSGELQVKSLARGVRLFRDRAFCAHEIPSTLVGKPFLVGPYADKPSARAEVLTDGMVAVVTPQSFDLSQTKILEEQGFARDLSIPTFQMWGKRASERSAVWRKFCRKGEKIVFGQWAFVCDFDASNQYVVEPTAKNRVLFARLSKEYDDFVANDIDITSPDYAVFIPPDPAHRQERVRAAMHDTYNDHFQVMRDESRGRLYAFWTQGTLEPMADRHIAFRQSSDNGVTWTETRILCGTTSTNWADAATCPGASWQQAMLSKSGRMYLLWSAGGGGMKGMYSDDGCETWSKQEFVESDFRTPEDVAAGRKRVEFCNWQRPLRLGPDGHFYSASSTSRGQRFFEYANIDDDPEIRDVKVVVRSGGDGRLLPAPEMPDLDPGKRKRVCEEAAVVVLPDRRRFCVMRSSVGSPLWSVSSDEGRTWSHPEQLRTKDGGELIGHSVSPCPIYDWKGCEAGSGLYFGLFHLAVTDHRGPLYIVSGHFDPKAHQPVSFDGKPKLFEPRSHWNSFYTSYTVDPKTGVGTLWYPDSAKFYLLGRDIDKRLYQ